MADMPPRRSTKAQTPPAPAPIRHTALWELANDRLDGRLAETITDLRDRGLSWRRMAMIFYADHGIAVADITLRNWGRRLADETNDEPAA